MSYTTQQAPHDTPPAGHAKQEAQHGTAPQVTHPYTTQYTAAKPLHFALLLSDPQPPKDGQELNKNFQLRLKHQCKCNSKYCNRFIGVSNLDYSKHRKKTATASKRVKKPII